MKKILLIILICATSLVGCTSKNVPTNNDAIAETTEEKSYDFRNSCWGDSIEDVKKSETLTLLEEDSSYGLRYNEDICGINMDIIYVVDKDKKLLGGMYSSTESHTNKNFYIDDYESLKKELTSKYGDPASDKVVWNNEMFKNNNENYGVAVSIGHLEYRSVWELDTTFVVLGLSGDNNDIGLRINYADKNNLPKLDSSGL